MQPTARAVGVRGNRESAPEGRKSRVRHSAEGQRGAVTARIAVFFRPFGAGSDF